MIKIMYFDWVPAGRSEFVMYTQVQLLLIPMRTLVRNIRIDKRYSEFVICRYVINLYITLFSDMDQIFFLMFYVLLQV